MRLGLGLGIGRRFVPSSEPEEPANLIDNGTFDSDDGLALTGGAAVSGGQLVFTGGGTASQDTNVTINGGEFFRLVLDITGAGGTSTLAISLGGGAAINAPAVDGPVAIYVLAGSADQALLFEAADLIIDNVVLTGPYTVTPGAEIAPDVGFNDPPGWTVTGTNASITDGAFVAAGGSGGKEARREATDTIEAGWHFVSFDLDRTSGTGLVAVSDGGTSVGSAVTGAVTGYAYSDASTQDINVRATSNANLSIDNVSVKPLTFTLA